MTLTGNVAQINKTVLEGFLQFTPLTQPTLVDSTVIGDAIYTIKSGEDGSFSADLDLGFYRVTVNNVNIIINIEEDEDALLEEVVVSTPSTGGGGGSGSGSGTGGDKTVQGHGSPEGVVSKPINWFYWDLDNERLYYKVSGTGNTGWRELVG